MPLLDGADISSSAVIVPIQIEALQSQNLLGQVRKTNWNMPSAVTLAIGNEVVASTSQRAIDRIATEERGEDMVARPFSLPFLSAAAYTGLLSHGTSKGLSIHFLDNTLDVELLADHLKDFGTFKSLLFHEYTPIHLSDIWFSGHSELRLRFYVDESGNIDPFNHATIKFYQYEEHCQQLAKLIRRHPIERRGISFITVELLNPLMPVLVSITDQDGETMLLDLLPFPSLCRGGRHHAELQALAWTGRYVDDLRLVSDSLIREYFGWSGLPQDFAIRDVRVDAATGTGAEPIHSAEIGAWMARVFGTNLVFEHSSNAADYHALPSVSSPRPIRNDQVALHIPADAIPSISALASRRLSPPADGPKSGPFVVSDAADGLPRWFVSMPSIPSWLDRVQPKTGGRFFPVITRQNDALTANTSEPLSADVPLAVRFMSSVPLSEEARVFPTARDAGRATLLQEPLEHALEHEHWRISVIVSVRDGVSDCLNFFSSLATQTIAQHSEIIIVDNRSSKSARHAIIRVAESLFPGRIRTLEFDAPFTHSAQSNMGADHSTGDFLVFANSDVILTDTRTIETLVILADNDNVASASCTLVHERGSSPTLRFRSAGVFPVELSLLGRPHLTFAEIDCETVLPNCTYPVAANSFALAVVKKNVWQQVGGLDANRFPADYNDVDYGLRALQMGLFHLCTSSVAAYHSGRASRGPSTDIHSVRYLTHLPLDRMMQSCTVIRKLHA